MAVTLGQKTGVEESIHGVVVRDPCRWLEEGSSPETKQWVADQKDRIEQYLTDVADIDVVRPLVQERLAVETVDQVRKIGERYFYRKRRPQDELPCICTKRASADQEDVLVGAAAKGESTSVSIYGVSSNASVLAYQLRRGGSDAVSIHFVDVESGIELPDEIPIGYPRGITFASDNSGIYYCHDIAGPCAYHYVRFHAFAVKGASDEVMFRVPKASGTKLVLTSDQTNLVAFYVGQPDNVSRTDVFIAKREAPRNWRRSKPFFDGSCRIFWNAGNLFAVDTRRASKGELWVADDETQQGRVLIPEKDAAIHQVVVIGQSIVVTRLCGWGMTVELWATSGRYIGLVELPKDGTVQLWPAQDSEVLFCSYESFGIPRIIYEFSPALNSLIVWHQQQNIGANPFYERVFGSATSRDGTEIPIVLLRKKTTQRQTNSPVLLTAYGGFGASVTPQYSALVSIMLDRGCIFALCQIRGGGEFGREWHESGRGNQKQNAFDDFIATAEWLCRQGITAPTKLAIFGGSNSGLLVGVALTQRPELFTAVLCNAALLDMLRYEKFDRASRWVSEYGSVRNEQEFQALYAYSPYHHVLEDVDYPSTLFITGDNDDRCNPAHVRKMARRLQERSAQRRPILVAYSHERGHSPALPLSTRVEALTLRIVFLCRELHIVCGGDLRA